MRASASVSTWRFSSRWWPSSMWPKSAPPGRDSGSRSTDASGQTCGRRCGLGSSTRTVSARQNRGLSSSVMRASTRSPGIASRDEDDTAVEPRDTDAAVRDVGNVEFDLAAPHLAHLSSLGARRRARRRRTRAALPRLDLPGPAGHASRRRASSRSRSPRTSTRRPPSPGSDRCRPRSSCCCSRDSRRRPWPGCSRTSSAPSTGSCSAVTRPSSSTGPSTASRTCPPPPANAGTPSAAGTASCTPATG